MDKKFLSAEEAVALFGIAAADLQRLVDEGQLKALADRGSWKYRREEIEQLIKSGALAADVERGQQTLEIETEKDESGSQDLAFLELDEQALAEGATMVNPKTDEPAAPLSPGSMPIAESLSEFELVTSLTGEKSPSDSGKSEESSVIIGVDEEQKEGSDSDVTLVPNKTPDSGIALSATTEHILTDEDHTLTPAEQMSGIAPSSDSDVRLADSGIALEPVDSGISLEADSGLTLESSAVFGKDSAIKPADSGLTLEADSGLTLEAIESGLSLDKKTDSGISLEAGDSGIALEAADSGIALGAGDSGLSLEDADSGIALTGKQKPTGSGGRPADTLAEIDQSDDELEATFVGAEDDMDRTAMLALDDSSELETLPPTKGMKAKSTSLSDSFGSEEVEDLEISEDLDDAELDVDEEEFEDVLDASDEAFSVEESGEAGDSSEASIASMPSMKFVAKEPSWGMAAVIPVTACAVLLLVQAVLLWDGISTMWTGETNQALTAPIIDAIGG